MFLLCLSFQASFISSGNRTDISLDDPNFWQKWAKIAEVEIDSKSEKVQRDGEKNIFKNKFQTKGLKKDADKLDKVNKVTE